MPCLRGGISFLLRSEISFSFIFHPCSSAVGFPEGSVSRVSRDEPSALAGAALTGTRQAVAQTLLQWAAAPCSSGESSAPVLPSAHAHEHGNTCCTPSSSSLISPITSFRLCGRIQVFLWSCSEFWERGTSSLQRDKDVPFFYIQPAGKQGQPDCFGTDGFLPCCGISLAKWSLTRHKY